MALENSVRKNSSFKNIKNLHRVNSMWLIIKKEDSILNYKKVMSLYSRSSFFWKVRDKTFKKKMTHRIDTDLVTSSCDRKCAKFLSKVVSIF